MTCSFQGCGRPILSRQICRGHYNQFSFGKPLTPLRKLVRGITPEARLLSGLIQSTTGYGDTNSSSYYCQEWSRGKTAQGHGLVCVGGSTLKVAHRLAWVFAFGDIPKKMEVRHHCGNPACANAAHLYLSTASERALDNHKKGLGNVILTHGEVSSIRNATKYRGVGKDLARKYKVDEAMISRIRQGKAWKSVK